MNAVVLILGLLLFISTSAAATKSVHGLRDNGISDTGECYVRYDWLVIPNLEVTIPFDVTDCYTLAARNDKVEVYIRQKHSFEMEKFMIILYDGNHLKVNPHQFHERYFFIQLNHKMLNDSDFPPEISVTEEFDGRLAYGQFQFRKHGMTVVYRSIYWKDVRISPRGVDGLCGFNLTDTHMDQLRRFQLKQVVQTPVCHVDHKEMASLSYRTNVTTRYTTKELKALDNLAREMRASPKEMECALAYSWRAFTLFHLYEDTKMWLQGPPCREAVAENHEVKPRREMLKEIIKLLLGP